MLVQNRKKIDQIDSKILKILLMNSRTSFTDIAKECKITIGAVRMRYKNMIKAGIINGHIMQVNPHSLGYKCIADIGILTAIENEKAVIDFLKTRPYVMHTFGMFGKYNLAIKVALKDLRDLTTIIEDLESNIYIKHVDPLIWANANDMDHNENLIIKPEPIIEEGSILLKKTPPINNEEVDIDEKDRQIAKILSANSRMPFKKIAEQLGISTKNTIQRFKKLEGNLLGLSTVTLDLTKLGYNAYAHNFIKVSNRSKMPEVYSQILSLPNTIVLVRMIGVYDLMTINVLEDFKDQFYLQDQMRKMTNIESVDTYIGPVFRAQPLNIFYPLL
ncbi:MAG: Lrp/AsnC family transcriptional regulator [Candidatus Bathyarchaeia archaeon]|jgi:Lrp/AsnC family transcriptional regulator for asnA, asnC and gidA